MEIWGNRREEVDGLGGVSPREANGIWRFFQHDFHSAWGVGVQAAWWQEAQSSLGTSWFTAAEAGGQRAVFVTLQFSEAIYLRLQASQDHHPGEDPSWTLALQWVLTLGHHHHPETDAYH